jgi:acetyl esterase/lipase
MELISRSAFVLSVGWLLGALLSLGMARGADSDSSPAAPSTPTTVPSVEFKREVVYGKGADQDLKLDLARPRRIDHARPCILFIHGGGWAHGSKSQFDLAIRTAAAKGYVAASIDYRLAPQYRFPAQVEDCKCAVRYLRSHAKQYGIDPNRIGALGDSAGGHLVLMLGVTRPEDGFEGSGGWTQTSSAVQAVVSWFGPTDLAAADMPEISKPIVREFLGTYPAPELGRKASPMTYVHQGECPILLLQGTIDPLVPYTQAVIMAKRISDEHAPGRAELLIGAGHGFVGEDLKHAIDVSVAFFDQHLHDQNRPER